MAASLLPSYAHAPRRRPGALIPLGWALVAMALLLVAYRQALHPWLINWGATPEEQRLALPGDDLLPAGQATFTRAITVEAPPAVVWRWIMQIGQDRAGFYSNDYLENLAGGDIHNVDELRPEWQARAVGDRVPMARADIARGAAGDAIYLPILALEPERMVTNLPGRFVLLPQTDGRTRLLLREPLVATAFVYWVYDPLHFVMEQRMLRGIKERAEGRPLVPALLQVIARAGWGLAGGLVAGLFLSRPTWWLWGLLCALAVAPSFSSTNDVDGALAGFLALGISVLGLLWFGRRWLGTYALLGAGVLLVLLLAPDSYAALGSLLAVASLALLSRIVWRSSTATAAPDFT